MNIDPVGKPDVSVEHIVATANACGFDNVITHSPPVASFPKAFKWVLLCSESDFVFYLEDDWKLTRPVALPHLIRLMKDFPKLASIRLAAFHANPDNMKNWNKFFPYDPGTGLYLCPEELRLGVGFCGHPCLIRGEFIDRTVPHLDVRKNPEKQFHNGGPKPITDEVVKWDYGVYSKPSSPPLVVDIGRKWMVKNKFRKAGNKAFFVNWERDE